eukprot:5330-Heterococcus_DN1.PRE.1
MSEVSISKAPRCYRTALREAPDVLTLEQWRPWTLHCRFYCNGQLICWPNAAILYSDCSKKQFELSNRKGKLVEVYVADCSAYLDKHNEVRASDSLHTSVAIIISRGSARRTA